MSEITTIAPVLSAVEEAGRIALRYYRSTSAQQASRKADGSIVTEADRAVEAHLVDAIRQLFPHAGILGEEGADRAPSGSGGWTFVLDPIDGTESYACGTPAWCIALGLLNPNHEPVAGIVYAPAWEGLFFADVPVQLPVLYNGEAVAPVAAPGPIETLLVDSKLYRTHRLDDCRAKLRSFGSTALHGALVAAQIGFDAAQLGTSFAWDIAASHALLRRVGMDIQHFDGRAVDYERLLGAVPTTEPLLAGPPVLIKDLGSSLIPR